MTVPDASCPNCRASNLMPFYQIDGVPAHSCLLMPEREQALGYPTGDLHLAFCENCGFITNQRFDMGLEEYSPLYEETQHFSARFNAFAHSLASRWIETYGIRDKQILEIGCGKGEFLDLLCELGGNRGIGVDPGCIPERMTEEARSRITVIQDYYSEKYSDLTADVVLCRHTLEHIPNTLEFVSMIRRALEIRPETLVLFELPDTTRVLHDRAFWDLYYEHCSYFTAGSLARLFRSCRFDLLELRRDYDDQYLLIAALPSKAPTEESLELENDFEETKSKVLAFRDDYDAKIQEWKSRLVELSKAGNRIIAWGSGSKCVSFLTTLGIGPEIDYVVDINPFKQGKYLPGTGHEIVAPEFLREQPPGAIVVMNPIYCDEIRSSLEDLGVTAELLPV